MSSKGGTVLPRYIQEVDTDLSGAKLSRFSLAVPKRGQGKGQAPPTNTDYVVITIPYKKIGAPIFSHSPSPLTQKER